MILATLMRPKIVIAPRRSMIWFALLSMAMVIASYLFVILLAAACVYFPFWLLARLQILQLQVLLFLLGGVVIACLMIWSILPRRDKFAAPGPLLKRESHPRLFAELDETAAFLDETLPRDVYLTDEVNAFVANRGGILGFGSHRIMGIGLPLLSILSVSECRAIMAHEFAHYYGGDTKLSPFVYRTQTAIARAFQTVGFIQELDGVHAIRALASLVSLVLQQYFTLFLRVTKLVSRKKEYRADELACLVAGVAPFRRGLQKIHASDIAWAVYWGTEIEPLLKLSYIAPLAAGFAQFLADSDLAAQLMQLVDKEIEQTKTNPFDTHPPLRNRIAAVEQLLVPPTDEDCTPAISLLDGLQSTELRLIAFANPKLDSNSLRPVSWEHIGPIVTIPAWKAMVNEHGSLLRGVTVGAFPDLLASVRDRSRMPDPPGMLLAREQRVDRVRQLLSSSLALALLEKGWHLEIKPGVFHFHRASERADALAMVNELIAGDVTAEAWIEKCTQLGIRDSLLVPAARLDPAD